MVDGADREVLSRAVGKEEVVIKTFFIKISATVVTPKLNCHGVSRIRVADVAAELPPCLPCVGLLFSSSD